MMCQQCIDMDASNMGGRSWRRWRAQAFVLVTVVSAARVGERRVRRASACVESGAERQYEASAQAALLSTGGCGVTTAARDHKRGSTLRAQRGRRMARRARATLFNAFKRPISRGIVAMRLKPAEAGARRKGE